MDEPQHLCNFCNRPITDLKDPYMVAREFKFCSPECIGEQLTPCNHVDGSHLHSEDQKVNTHVFVNHDPTAPFRVVTDIRNTDDGIEVEYGFITFPPPNQVELIEEEEECHLGNLLGVPADRAKDTLMLLLLSGVVTANESRELLARVTKQNQTPEANGK